MSGVSLLRSLGVTSRPLLEPTLVFFASVLGTTASIAGIWIAKQHDDRTDARLTLETVTTGLNLIGQGSGYAPSAQVAGALATLIHLGQPVIAIRSLRAAWLDQAVDAGTATWLIGEVLDSGRDESQREAAQLLCSQASVLCGPIRDSDGAFDIHWPYRLYERWPFQLPLDARMDVLSTLIAMLLSKPYVSWRETGYNWIIALLDDALTKDRDPSLCAEVGHLQRILLRTIPKTRDINWGSGWKSVDGMRHRADSAVAKAKAEGEPATRLTKIPKMEARLGKWATAASPPPRLRPESSAYQAGRRIRTAMVNFLRRKDPRGTRLQCSGCYRHRS